MTAAVIPFPARPTPAPAPAPASNDWNTGDCPHCLAKSAQYDHALFGCKLERNAQ